MVGASPYSCFFFFNDTATTEIYTLSLHDALPISLISPYLKAEALRLRCGRIVLARLLERSSLDGNVAMPSTEKLDTHQRSEEHTSELQSQSNLVCRLLLEKKKTQ